MKKTRLLANDIHARRSTCHHQAPTSSLAPVKYRMETFWYWLIQVRLEKRPLNEESFLCGLPWQTGQSKGKVKVKVHTLDIAPLCSESSPQKRSGMERVLKGFHSFTCTPTRSSAIDMSHSLPAFAFPAAAGTHLPTPEERKAE